MNYIDFYNALMTGDFDADLDKMIDRVNDRRKMIAPNIYHFRVGDRVQIKNSNPKYLNGAMATVTKINRTKVVVDLDERRERFFRNITTPTSMLEKV
jgi:hypothetical protein